MNRLFTSLICLLLVCTTAWSKVRLPEILSDNMVLQQDMQVKLWGWAEADARVTVRPSWTGKEYATQADAEGRWVVTVQTPKAGYEPQYIEVSDGETLRIDNVLIGEVWFCSGQSNMQMPLGGFLDASVEGGNETVATANLKTGIRMVNIPRIGAAEPQEECKGTWNVCTTKNASEFSAVGFYFAERLNQILDVPVGIINCSWSGSCLEGWLPKEIVQNYSNVDLSKAAPENKRHYHAGVPTIMYNGMVKPLINYTIKGFLWYQGEANVKDHVHYADRMVALVNQWRKDWTLGELPFYMVEIAPFADDGNPNGETRAFLREAQYKAVSRLANSGIVCTNDLVYPYEQAQIHPCRKKEVGDRLAYLALNKDYGYQDIACESPTYKRMEVKEDKAIIHFHNLSGFSSYHAYTGFEICGEDHVFHPAQAKTHYSTRTVTVWSEEVKKPVAVRYCFRNFLLGNLKTNRELPFAPFRTDDFPEKTVSQ